MLEASVNACPEVLLDAAALLQAMQCNAMLCRQQVTRLRQMHGLPGRLSQEPQHSGARHSFDNDHHSRLQISLLAERRLQYDAWGDLKGPRKSMI